MWPYPREEEAITDVLRLSRGMTYKAAVAGLPLGGGKSVIIGDPRTEKSPALLAAMGRAVNALGGRYIIAEDVGTSAQDMAIIRRTTRHVTGLPASDGGNGDPSPFTALGVVHGMRAAVRHATGRESLAGMRVAVQGLGHVGWHLCRLLHDAGAKLIVADIDSARVAAAEAAYQAVGVPAEAVHRTPADVFAPCALGGVLNSETIPALGAGIIAGAANNQLRTAADGAALRDRGIVYAPDYVINAGGLIAAANEYLSGGRSSDRTIGLAVERLFDTTRLILERADTQGLPSAEAADRLAQERLHRHPASSHAAE